MPMLSTAEAICASTFVSASFVGVLYALPARIAVLGREEPRQIKARIGATGVATLLAALVVRALVVARDPRAGSGSGLHAWMGLGVLDGVAGLAAATAACTRALLLSALLFLGSLCADGADLAFERTHWVARDGSTRIRAAPLGAAELMRAWPAAAAWAALLSPHAGRRWPAARNLIAAPLLEELAFRAAICPLLLAAGIAPTRVCAVAPLFFGVAHVHHGVVAVRAGTKSVTAAVASVLVQLTYTSLFGMFAAFVFVRTGRVAGAFATHAFCNTMGLPNVAFLWAGHHAHRHRAALLTVYGVGIAAFFYGLYPLTAGFEPLPWPPLAEASFFIDCGVIFGLAVIIGGVCFHIRISLHGVRTATAAAASGAHRSS